MIENQHTLWQPLRLLSLYRLLVAITLIALAPTSITFGILGDSNPVLYTAAASTYALLALFWLITCRYFQSAFLVQLYFQFITDLSLVTLMMHASGGIESGLGMLLVVSIAGNCMLVRGITPYFLAAIATLTILGDSLYAGLFSSVNKNNYSAASALGVAFFGVAFLTSLLSRRLAESEELASKRNVALGNLEQVNEFIVNQFQNGVIVVDAHNRVQLINQTATEMLNNKHRDNALLHHWSEELSHSLEHWKAQPQRSVLKISQPGSAYKIQPSYQGLDLGAGSTLITLTDISDISKELQDQKLASLGRLTASIAHEIRNPLSAINHAAQLLDESEHINDADSRLTHIINQQSHRLNSMVENIMQLSRKNKAVPEKIQLDSWLGAFRIEFCSETGLPGKHFLLNIHSPHQVVDFDASQLHQVLWNLCTNSMKYGRNEDGECTIYIDCDISAAGERYLDIYDSGAGIDKNIADHIFEPFYTTSSSSSGLGLYISHELCAFNHARLSYQYNEHAAGRFRLSLPTT